MSCKIQQELREQLKEALKQKDTRRSNVVRQIETEVSNARAAPGFAGEIDDELYRRVIAAYSKKMDKARREYEGLGERGVEMAETLAFEVEFLSRWLPTKLDEAATRALVKQVIDETGVTAVAQAGRVIGQIMKKHKEEVDGALVNRLVREALAG